LFYRFLFRRKKKEEDVAGSKKAADSMKVSGSKKDKKVRNR
jgi:hypothetical protein